MDFKLYSKSMLADNHPNRYLIQDPILVNLESGSLTQAELSLMDATTEFYDFVLKNWAVEAIPSYKVNQEVPMLSRMKYGKNDERKLIA